VRQFLPDVVVPPEGRPCHLATLASLNLFETVSFSEADSQRGTQYQEEAQRELTKTHFTNINDYLISLGMEIRLNRFNPFNLPRIAQLIQRSNQFNPVTRRYGEVACKATMILRFSCAMLKSTLGRIAPIGQRITSRTAGA
jgi:predicted enzyme involved in methoxymalonyl-ACP biosynthesis